MTRRFIRVDSTRGERRPAVSCWILSSAVVLVNSALAEAQIWGAPPSGDSEDPLDSPTMARLGGGSPWLEEQLQQQQQQLQDLQLHHQHRHQMYMQREQDQLQLQGGSPTINIAGVEFSRDDDIANMEQLSTLIGQIFYTSIFAPNDPVAQQQWVNLKKDIWALVQYAAEVPAIALAVSMVLYNYFFWEGPESPNPDVDAGWTAAQLMHRAVVHTRCNDPDLPPMTFYIKQCHLKWRYTIMLAQETARHLVMQRRDIVRGARALAHLNAFFRELSQLPMSTLQFGLRPAEINFNVDYYPGVVARHGPIWANPARVLPMAAFLEAHFSTIRGELDAILDKGLYRSLDEQTRNAETQFGPRGDDWLTAYMYRKGEQLPSVCMHAPKTCELLSTRPEIAECRSTGSGAGFLRMAPGGRLKPHFGNAPRVTVHLALIVPEGEITMSVGHETVRWTEGKSLVFDDTFVHQVTHNGHEPRYVMLTWMCHPCDRDDGKLPGETVPAYCDDGPGPMAKLGLAPLPRRS
eukprot:TRINITY_DN5503_c0_g2_i1.p1 TRINITY_DN5503_c0_g2~~TRINITY_DN5503_c0_g2_i1.p1  ORF type:complete len:520 (-),score=81.73 TRINITY_DN5503_c0_g2_i1:85-1644(-)